MDLTIANVSTKVSDADLQAAVSAIGRQVTEQFQPEWGVAATLHGTTTSSLKKIKIQGESQQNAIIYLGDSSQDPTTGVEGALGYHAVNHADLPYGFVYLDIATEYGDPWTSVLSHEVLELLADPDAVTTVTGPSPNDASGSVYYDLEVADPTQGDSYTIDNVTVSNFVGCSYFGMTGGNGKTNYLNLPLVPFGVRPGGYFQYEDGSGVHQIQGEKVTPRQLAAKILMKNGRRNDRRSERRRQRFNPVNMATLQGAKMTTQHPSLRVLLATNPDLRHKIQQAIAIAAYNVIKDAGITVTSADIADAQSDIAAMTVPPGAIKTDATTGAIKMDTVGDVASIASSVATIAVLAGF